MTSFFGTLIAQDHAFYWKSASWVVTTPKLQPSPFLVVPTWCTLCANPLACLVPLYSAASRLQPVLPEYKEGESTEDPPCIQIKTGTTWTQVGDTYPVCCDMKLGRRTWKLGVLIKTWEKCQLSHFSICYYFCKKIHFSCPGSILAHYFSVLKSMMVLLKERARGFGVLLGYTFHHPAHLLNLHCNSAKILVYQKLRFDLSTPVLLWFCHVYLNTNQPMCLFTHSKGIKIGSSCQELRGCQNPH